MGHALADQNSNVRVAKVDCTRFPSVASALGVGAYPTLILFVFLKNNLVLKNYFIVSEMAFEFLMKENVKKKTCCSLL